MVLLFSSHVFLPSKTTCRRTVSHQLLLTLRLQCCSLCHGKNSIWKPFSLSTHSERDFLEIMPSSLDCANSLGFRTAASCNFFDLLSCSMLGSLALFFLLNLHCSNTMWKFLKLENSYCSTDDISSTCYIYMNKLIAISYGKHWNIYIAAYTN